MIGRKEFQGKFTWYPKQHTLTTHTPQHIISAVETKLTLGLASNDYVSILHMPQ